MNAHIGYGELLKTNKSFRKLFIADWVSYLGDWFSVIAMFILASNESDGSPLAIAMVLVFRMLGIALTDPFTGMLADRFSRKKLLIVANLSATVVILFSVNFELLNNLTNLYIFAFLLMFCRAIYDPAHFAYLPNITDENELLTANALSSMSWSAALGFGAALGGFVIAEFGVTTGLLIDSSTFVLAVLLIMTLPEGGPTKDTKKSRDHGVFSDIRNGLQIVINTPRIRRIITAKGLWAVGGGAQVFLLILIGAEAGFGSVAAGVGVLYMARGFGSGCGPIIGRYLWPDKSSWPSLIGPLVGLSGLFYIIISQIEWTMILLPLIFISHGASGTNWVFSNTMIQQRSDDSWLGRASGFDSLIMSTTFALSVLFSALILEFEYASLRETIFITGILQITAGILWNIFGLPAENEWIKSQTPN